MARTVNDLLDPRGKLDPEVLFPGKRPTTYRRKLTQYLTNGYEQATADGIAVGSLDDAAVLWAYWLTYDGLYTARVNLPAQASIKDEADASYTADQLARLQQLATDAWDAYQALVTGATGTSGETPRLPSRAMPTVAVW